MNTHPENSNPIRALNHPEQERGTFDLYATITQQIINIMEGGVIPWRSPVLTSGPGMPVNLASGRAYTGINVFLLACRAWAEGFSSAYWLTFKQVQDRGGRIKPGSKGSMVIFWKQYQTTDPTTGEEKEIPVIRYSKVFNIDQCEGIKAPEQTNATPKEFSPIAACEKIVVGYVDGPEIVHGGKQPCYLPSRDLVRMPEPINFENAESYFSTLYHELAHSSGHEKRLNRGFDGQTFGSVEYGKEELIAEMAAAFLCGDSGICPAVLPNQAAYLDSWLKQIRQDKRLLISAASAGQRAANWIKGQRNDAR